MTCNDIIEKHLKDNGYDGLYDEDDGCGCSLENLMPCGAGAWVLNCSPGYKTPCDCLVDQHVWHISPKPFTE